MGENHSNLTFEQWEKKYRPIKNHLDPNAGWDGTLYETFGDEVAHVWEQAPEYCWTLIEGDGFLWITNGRTIVNRLGYFITKHPAPRKDFIDVIIEEDELNSDQIEMLDESRVRKGTQSKVASNS